MEVLGCLLSGGSRICSHGVNIDSRKIIRGINSIRPKF